jgi:LuxR family maltose regulon positive regulatory protein
MEEGAPLLDSAFGLHLSRGLYGLSYLREGDMREAERVLQDVVVAADRACGMFSEPACNAAAFLSAVLYEANRLDGLRTLLDPRFDVIERVGLPEAAICAAVSRIRLHSLDGSHAEAQAELDQLEEQAQRRGLSRMQGYVLAERTRLFMRMGRTHAAFEQLDALRATTAASGRSASDREVNALALWTEAHWCAWRDEPARALELLSLLEARGAWRGQKRKQVQVDAFAALLEDRLGQPSEAQRRVARVMAQSRELGLVRSVLDFGERLLELGDIARQAGALAPSSSFYLEHLKLLLPRQAPVPVSSPASLQQRLSARELEVLRSMALSMSNKRVAQALAISPETVKWHLKNIYGKLEVYGRDDAVAKARNLGWLETPGRAMVDRSA